MTSKGMLRPAYGWIRGKFLPTKLLCRWLIDPLKSRLNLLRYAGRQKRLLEIGCAGKRMDGFETLSIEGGFRIDYVFDASRNLPFRDNTFDLIFASHVLEHIPWHLLKETLCEWLRILKPWGRLEIWVPNGLMLAKALCDLESDGPTEELTKPQWPYLNPENDAYTHLNIRIFAYGDGSRNLSHPNWHRCLFTPKSLTGFLIKAGFKEVAEMAPNQSRNPVHGDYNLGVNGRK